MQNKKRLFIAAVVVLAAIVLVVFKPWKSDARQKDSVKVVKGTFETYIIEVGELKAQHSLDILIPEVAFRRDLDIWGMKILDIVEEGKIVKKGDHVATLDPTEVVERIKSVDSRLDGYYNSLENARLDSSLTLSSARDAIQKSKDLIMDKKIKVEQSVYESKAVQRQAQLELEMAKRSLEGNKRELEKKRMKARVVIERYQRKIAKYEKRKKLYEQLMSELDIKSPADGMIVYGRGYEGKIKVGSTVGRWAPLIATLPDLSSLISEMFVKEVNIAKIAIGNKVRINVDAFPDAQLTGEIIKIANIGQEIPGEYQNGFKVLVRLDPFHVDLLPGMTTVNTVITGVWEDALMVPKNAVFSNDSVKYVIKRSGLGTEKQEVVLGAENEDFFMIASGLEEGDVLLLEENR